MLLGSKAGVKSIRLGLGIADISGTVECLRAHSGLEEGISMKRGRFMPAQSPGKAPTGLVGFDDITAGGVPRGRTTLLRGGPGCGNTLFTLQSFKANRE